MNGLTYWWRKVENLRAMVNDYKKKHKITGDIEEVLKHLLENQ